MSKRTIFNAKAGEKLVIRSAGIGVADPRRETMVDRVTEFECVATDQFERVQGTMRRLVKDVDPPLIPGMTEAWLNDAELDVGAPPE